MDRKTAISIAALAGATLLLESAFLRLLAVAQYYHFAFLVVSLALLGFGAGGTLLSISDRLRTDLISKTLAWSGGGFAFSAGLAYLVINILPFDSYSIAWDSRQVLYFALYFFALALPFIFSGIGIGAGLASAQGGSHFVYAANLLGSAVGAALGPVVLGLTGVPGAVLASCLGTLPAGYLPRWLRGATLVTGLTILAFWGVRNSMGQGAMGLEISPYKGLSYARQYPGSQELYGAWSPVSRVDVVARAGTRHLPGLSYVYQGEIPEQVGVAIDGNHMQPVSLVSPDEFPALEFLPEHIAFELAPGPDLLVLNPGGGLGVLQGLGSGSAQVTAVLGDPLLVEAVKAGAGPLSPYTYGQVIVVLEQPRVYLQNPDAAFDLVYLPLTDAYRPISSGAYSLTEDYLLTVEGVEKMLAALQPEGILVVSRWLQTPPSESLRIVALLDEALRTQGVADPSKQMVAFRGIQTMTVLVRSGGWRQADLATIRAFIEDRKYDLVWAPEIEAPDVNRFNKLSSPDYYVNVRSLLNSQTREDYLASYPFAILPPTDDRPFFFHFFTWQQAPEILQTFGKVWGPFGGSGFLLIFALLGLVILLSGGLILVPVIFWNRDRANVDQKKLRWLTLLYFGSLGLAFLFIEIPLIQRWILLLGHPSYAFAVVIMTLLLFSSLGSRYSVMIGGKYWKLLGFVVLFAILTPWLADRVISFSLGWPLIWRVLMASLSLAPLAFTLGVPFPAGLAWLERMAPELMPWAWAVNGCASVMAAVLAALFGLQYGFNFVLGMGAGLYALAWLASIGFHRANFPPAL